MKRQSAAEAALRKQVKILEASMEQQLQALDHLRARIDNTRSIRDQLEDEISRLYAARVAASESRKP